MKTLAGLKLDRRKPKALPARAAAAIAISTFPLKTATAASVRAPMPLMPAARPSMPSSQLTALMMKTIQIYIKNMRKFLLFKKQMN